MSKLYAKDEEICINVKPITEEVEEKISEAASNETMEIPSDNSIDNKELFDDIKEIIQGTKEVKREERTYFSLYKCPLSYNVDDSPLAPSKLVLFNIRKFEELYLKQLEEIIYTKSDNINPNNLIPFLLLMNYIVKSNNPINLKTNRYRKLLPRINTTLNKFFTKNYSVLFSIYTMFNSYVDTEKKL